MTGASTFLTGAISCACGVIALFFLRFWRTTHDPFFVYFALSFALEAVGRGASAFLQLPDENPGFYGGHPSLKAIAITFYTNTDSLISDLRSGQIDGTDQMWV